MNANEGMLSVLSSLLSALGGMHQGTQPSPFTLTLNPTLTFS